jgi:TolB-like protein
MTPFPPAPRAVLAALLLAVALDASAAADRREKIAVMKVDAPDLSRSEVASLRNLLEVGVTQAVGSRLQVMTRDSAAAMIGGGDKLVACMEGASCDAEIGGALGVDYLLSGQVGQIGSRYHLSLQLFDARKARVLGRVARFSERDEDALARALQSGLGELRVEIPGIRPRPPDAISARPDPAARPGPRPGPSGPAIRPHRTAAAWTAGASAALLAGGAVLGLTARQRLAALRDDWRSPDYAATYPGRRDQVRRLSLAADGCFALGAVGLGAATWLFTRTAPAPVALVPALDQGQLGLAVAGRF